MCSGESRARAGVLIQSRAHTHPPKRTCIVRNVGHTHTHKQNAHIYAELWQLPIRDPRVRPNNPAHTLTPTTALTRSDLK